jgi:hypothetical protein
MVFGDYLHNQSIHQLIDNMKGHLLSQLQEKYQIDLSHEISYGEICYTWYRHENGKYNV